MVNVSLTPRVWWLAVLQEYYLAIAALFIVSTFFEGEERGGRWDIFRLFGLLAGLVWPVLLAGALVEVLRQDKAVQRSHR